MEEIMAERRMFSKSVIDSDAFMDMPLSAQALYFHLAIRADDDGFLGNPKMVMRMICASEDDLKLLIAKNFIITFCSGVIVITHWKMHNYIRTDRYKETIHKDEKELLSLKNNGMYTIGIPSDNQVSYQPDTQDRSGKDSIGKYKDDLSIINRLTENEIKLLKDSCTDFDRLIRYADAKIKLRENSSPISDPYSYLKAIIINEGFLKNS
jgi:hypothetical protein